MPIDAVELRPGLWRWTVPHPDWTPDREKPGGWGRMVGCLSYEPADPGAPFILIDPLAPPEGTPEAAEFWRELDADVARRGKPVAILLANYFHERSTPTIQRRYKTKPGVEVWAHAAAASHIPATSIDRTFLTPATLPGGIVAYPVTGLMDAETVLYIPEHRAVAAADALIGAEKGRLRVPPHWWAEETPEGQLRYREELRKDLRALLEHPIDMVLVSHGAPVLSDGARALSEGLEAPAWGE